MLITIHSDPIELRYYDSFNMLSTFSIAFIFFSTSSVWVKSKKKLCVQICLLSQHIFSGAIFFFIIDMKQRIERILKHFQLLFASCNSYCCFPHRINDGANCLPKFLWRVKKLFAKKRRRKGIEIVLKARLMEWKIYRKK